MAKSESCERFISRVPIVTIAKDRLTSLPSLEVAEEFTTQLRKARSKITRKLTQPIVRIQTTAPSGAIQQVRFRLKWEHTRCSANVTSPARGRG